MATGHRESANLCFGLNDLACSLLVRAARKMGAVLMIVARYGLTGSVIAVGLMLLYALGRRWSGTSLGPM